MGDVNLEDDSDGKDFEDMSLSDKSGSKEGRSQSSDLSMGMPHRS